MIVGENVAVMVSRKDSASSSVCSRPLWAPIAH